MTWNGSSLTFDAEGRMTQFGRAQADLYDRFGMRAVKATTATHPQDAGTTYYLYDGDTQIAAANLNGKVLWVNAFGETGLLGESADGGYHLFYTFDTTGNIAQRWNNTAFDSAYGFDGYGQPLAGTVGATYGNYDPHTGYSSQGGGYYDYDTNLVLMGHRYYDPSSGRFLNRDPSGYGGGINLYSYTHNNPVNHSDPLGLDDMMKTKADDTDYARLRTDGYSGTWANQIVSTHRAAENAAQAKNAKPFEEAAEFAAASLIPVDGLLGAILGKAGELANGLASTYKMESWVNRSDILAHNRSLYDMFKAQNGKIICRRSESMIGKSSGKPINGYYNALENNIYLYKGANLGTLTEELIHFQQADEFGYIGTGFPTSEIGKFENNAAKRLLKLGFEVVR